MLITPLYAAVFGLFFVFLSARVIWIRRHYKVAFGVGEHKKLERAVRVHGNFSEYVPLTFLLIYFVEIENTNAMWIHALSITFLVARCSHAFGVSRIKEDLRFRVCGLFLTGVVICASALMILVGRL